MCGISNCFVNMCCVPYFAVYGTPHVHTNSRGKLSGGRVTTWPLLLLCKDAYLPYVKNHKQDRKVWNIWLRIETREQLLWTQTCALWLHEAGWILWVCESLLSSWEGLCCLQLVNSLRKFYYFAKADDFWLWWKIVFCLRFTVRLCCVGWFADGCTW